jgi:hypothetical protein
MKLWSQCLGPLGQDTDELLEIMCCLATYTFTLVLNNKTLPPWLSEAIFSIKFAILNIYSVKCNFQCRTRANILV